MTTSATKTRKRTPVQVAQPRTSNTAACRIHWGTRDGLCWQTRRAYSRERANSLARMFAANPRNVKASCVAVGRNYWAIRIYPATMTGFYSRVLTAMNDKLRTEGTAYQFTSRPDGLYDCLNPKSGGEYVVGPDGCTCPQSARAAMIGAPCKHRARANALGLFPPAGDAG